MVAIADPPMDAFLAIVQHMPFVGVFRTDFLYYALLNGMHILALGVFLGAILPLDLGILRLRGFAWAATAEAPMRRMAVAAFVGVATTGLVLFTVRPADYLGNSVFLGKIGLIALAGCNVILFHRLSGPAVRRVLAGVSVATWLSVLFAGRLIGFV